MNEKIVVKQKVEAPLEIVWKAITQKTEMKNWYFDIPDFELKLNHIFHFFEPGGENKYHHECEILEIIPHQKLKHSWAYPEFSHEKTMVVWELEKANVGTLITLTHTGFEGLSNLGKEFQKESFESGWKEILGKSLKEFIEDLIVE